MPLARIRVELPDGTWKADVTREHPETLVCLTSTTMMDEGAIEVVVLSSGSFGECLCALRNHSDVNESVVVQQADRELTIQLETADPVLLSAANRSATPLAYPLTVHDGRMVVDVVGTHDSISGFGAELQAVDLGFDVSYVQRDHEMGRVLTERQQEFVLAAVEYGYYETPRRCSLTELATRMDVAKSTCSGTLHRAEQALVEYFLTNHATTQHTDWATDSPPQERAREEWVG